MAKSSTSPDYLILLGKRPPKVEQFAAAELQRELKELLGIDAEIVKLGSVSSQRLGRYPLFILGAEKSNGVVTDLVARGALKPERHEQGFAVKSAPSPFNSRRNAVAVAGADARGTLYAVRDLAHYHLLGNKARSRLAHLNFRSYPTTLRRGCLTWEYYIDDWRTYIDRLSDWKQNTLMICGHPYMLEQPEMFDYAAEQGVDVYVGMGIFSWEFTQIKVHRAQAWLPDAPPKWVTLSPNGYVICPSEPKSFKWQIDRIVEIIRAMPKVKGFLFQTGILDFPDCDCPKCSKLSPDQRYLMMANPVIDAVLKERPDIYVVHSIGIGQLTDKEFVRSLRHIDRRSTLMIETGIIPKPSHVDLAQKANFEGGKVINTVKLYGQAGTYGYVMDGWRDMRRKMMHDVYNGIARCVTQYGTDSSFALNQTRDYGPKDLFLPAFFGETSWHAGRTKESSFVKLVDRMKEITDLDMRVSDPPQTRISEGKSVCCIKRPEGTLVDGGWIWGQIRIVTPLVADTCDLLSESESATYTFKLPSGFRKGLKSARLVLRGAKTDKAVIAAAQTGEVFAEGFMWRDAEVTEAEKLKKGTQPPYFFDIGVNGKKLRRVKCTWGHGKKVVRTGTFFGETEEEILDAKMPNEFAGKSDWKIDIPKSWLKPKTSVTLSFLEPDGLVMYDKMTLKLSY